MPKSSQSLFLKQFNLTFGQNPNLEQWQAGLKKVAEAFQVYDQENGQLQKMLELGYQEMQKMWELIQHREDLAKAIFDASQDMILVLDKLGQVVEYNLAFQKAVDLKEDLILGRSVFELLPQGTMMEALRKCFDSPSEEYLHGFLGNRREHTVSIPGKKDLLVSFFPSRIHRDQTTRYPLYIRDITHERAAEEEIERGRVQLLFGSKLSALGEMAGGVAHEINTPLAVIQMRTEQLLENLKDPSMDHASVESALKAIDITVKRISKIVNGLRLFARDGRGDVMTVCSASKIVDDTFSLCREKFKNHGVALTYESAKDLDFECRAGEISQVLLNFLNNAYDSIQELDEKWVKVAVESISGERVCLSVTDSGTGIPLPIQEKMMQPFFTTKEIGKGTGLGLSISKGIIDSHRGHITVDNASPNTKIMMILPKSQAVAK